MPHISEQEAPVQITGAAYFAPPGCTPIVTSSTEIVEFSPDGHSCGKCRPCGSNMHASRAHHVVSTSC